MEINEALKIVEKNLTDVNTELGFNRTEQTDSSITFEGKKGAYRVVYDNASKTVAFECSNEEGQDFNTISRSLFDPEEYTERDAKSLANEINDEISGLFKVRKKVDLDKVKMPKAVSRAKAKSGLISYDTDSLANRFGTLFPDMKEPIRANIAKYGEFLPETFFTEIGTQRVLDVIKNGDENERKRLFKMLNEVYEDGTNEVQDIIGVTILGEIKGDKEMLDICDQYMIEYMAGPVHEINKLTKKKSSLTRKLLNPPPYKPKKKSNMMQNALQAQNVNR